MALGSNSTISKIFLTVGFGKIRQKSLENKQKVDKDTPGSVKRQTQSGTDSWALEHDYIIGKIENIFYKEDVQYGNSFEIVISDVADTYQLSLSETSRYCVAFLKKLPNIDLTNNVKLIAYDFTDKEGKRKSGLSIEQEGQKIGSYYERKQEDGKWKLLYKFPDPKGIDFHDKDEAKIYFIRVKKFLKSQFDELFKDTFGKTINQEHINVVNKNNDIQDESLPTVGEYNDLHSEDSDLPF
jgi:hypothetical protein